MGLMNGGFPGGMGGCVVWGTVGVSLSFGLVRGPGVFTRVFPSFTLVSRIPFAQRYRVNTTSFNTQCLLRDVKQWSMTP